MRIAEIFALAVISLGICAAQNANNTQSTVGISSWTMNSSHLETHVSEHDGYLTLKKSKSAETSFMDGLLTNFQDTKVGHVRFYFSSTQKEKEDTNLRLKSSQSGRTAVSFRCGYAGFVRVNDNQMVDFYNDTISSETQLIWTKADITVDWNSKEVNIYLNDTYKGKAEFYHDDVTSVDTLMLYNLNPDTTSYWKNIEVCEGKCAGFKSLARLSISLSAFLGLLFLLFN